jgi:hypothetical protein
MSSEYRAMCRPRMEFVLNWRQKKLEFQCVRAAGKFISIKTAFGPGSILVLTWYANYARKECAKLLQSSVLNFA